MKKSLEFVWLYLLCICRGNQCGSLLSKISHYLTHVIVERLCLENRCSSRSFNWACVISSVEWQSKVLILMQNCEVCDWRFWGRFISPTFVYLILEFDIFVINFGFIHYVVLLDVRIKYTLNTRRQTRSPFFYKVHYLDKICFTSE